MEREHLQSSGAPYTITYDTRPDCEAYLLELDPDRADENIDFFHLHAAYECIRHWFNGHDTRRQYVANKFYGYLFESVRVIWYEAPTTLEPTTLFTRLNVGRIPLTDAELVKALLLSSDRTKSGRTSRVQEIAAQWDGMERDLRNPDIWAFIADDATSESPTRITLLLDSIAGGPRGKLRPRFHTFDVLRAKMLQETMEFVWDEIVQLHALILGWYENRDQYHKIGYLVAIGQRFGDLVTLARGKTKSEFNDQLDRRIRDSIALTPSEVATISYESDPQKCSRLLLLLNAETVRRIRGSTERYSFRIHRSQAWSLEHIHAQHAEMLTKAEQWLEWLKLHREALVDLRSIDEVTRGELLQRIDALSAKPDRRESFQTLARDIALAFTAESDTSSSLVVHTTHSISNLALLASGHNSALSNAVFEVKRRRILALDRNGEYIPVCTRQVFLKYYTDADAQQIHFWSNQDRDAYLTSILSVEHGIGAYLKPEALTE
jgi:hypothetical protein